MLKKPSFSGLILIFSLLLLLSKTCVSHFAMKLRYNLIHIELDNTFNPIPAGGGVNLTPPVVFFT